MTIAIPYFFASGASLSTVGPGTASAASYQRRSCPGQKYGPLKISCRHRIWTPFLPASWIIGRCFSSIAAWISATGLVSSLMGLEAWIRPAITLRAMLVRHQVRGFLRDVALPRLGILVGAAACGFLGVARRLLAVDEIVGRGEVRQALADELADASELVVGNDLRELVLELADDLVAAQHRAGAHLHRRRAEQHELRRVGAGLDAADAADRHALVRARDLHHLAQRDRAHALAAVAARDAVALDGRHRAQRLEVDADDAEDRVDHRDAIGARAERCTGRHRRVADVRRHLRPHRDPRHLLHPADDLLDDVGVLAHRHAHLALGQAVRAAQVQLEAIDAGLLDLAH